ncbi:bactofilin family protein [Methylophaga sp. OBS4]|uniref:bactofilin family protein n=1 Tax=Methylophaga sp. OBS4 TaxID=2991935 RepID=UPI00225734FD|nr:polymer-forming cytoskeletal protein [Methylophaga sp. OBS4]MCX4188003.1 polymer-forming cytoskeletal protein [Methylophaga sp. OBS4]
MFKKDKPKKSKSTNRIDTLIGRHTHIKGDINFSGGLRIDGSIAGNINATEDDTSLLTLSDHGNIEGEVRVPNVIINGQVTGNVYASQHVELAPKARINGNLYYRMLEMAMGSEVNGHLIRAQEQSEDILSVEHEVFDNEEQFHLEQKA